MRTIILMCFLLYCQNAKAQPQDTGCFLINSISWAAIPSICTGDTIRFRATAGNLWPITTLCCLQMGWWQMPDGVEIVDTFNRVQALVCFTKPGYYFTYGDYQQGEGLNYLFNGEQSICSMGIEANVYDCVPSIRLESPISRVCVGDSVQFVASAHHVPTDWEWHFDSATNLNVYHGRYPPNVAYDTPGIYTVRLKASNTAGADSLVHTIEVLPRPTRIYDIELDEQYTLRPSDTLRLHTAYQSDYYNWQPSVTNLACLNCANPLFTATTEGYYPFVCTAGVGECSENNYIGVTVKDDIRYFAPTAFTPNGDGLNELFEIKGYDIDIKSIKIFDRWGNLVYYGEGNGAAWDGANHLSGNYVWLMECTDRYNNQPKTRKGSVMLLR